LQHLSNAVRTFAFLMFKLRFR